jgi:rSAM/selenodomain-associated transferase 2
MTAWQKQIENPKFSVIIPVYRETAVINSIIGHIRSLNAPGNIEIVIVDGDPQGSTLQAIGDETVKKIISRKSRGMQLCVGAKASRGGVLIFLHADTFLPHNAFVRIASLMATDNNCMGGAFELQIDSSRPFFRIIEKASTWRSRMTRVPYGDQAIFIRSGYYHHLGGFKNIPIMEDVELMKRIRKDRGKIVILSERVITSARRWESEGVLRCTIRNWILITLYALGVAPEKLSHYYGE